MLVVVLTVIYIILGIFLDGASMILLTLPVVLPIISHAGFDLIWFGIFLIIVIEMAELSPPVGFNLFVLQHMTGRGIFYIAAASMPFFLLMIVGIAIITVWPDIVLIAPRLFN
jgi:TRAP-type C4-dicarboxylate transport system permease large subunit